MHPKKINFWKFLKGKIIFLLINVIILLIGVFVIYIGISANSKNWQSIWISIGTSLIATSVVLFLDLWRQISTDQLLGKISNVIFNAGIQHVYQRRDIEKYESLVNKLSGNLDINGYSLGGFFDSFSEVIRLRIAKNSGISVRILLVDPLSEYSIHRAELEGRSKNEFKERVNTVIRFFKEVDKVEIRFISTPLSTMIFRVDDKMFIGPHFYKKQSKSTVTIELESNHFLFNEYLKEYERMWKDAKPAQIVE